MVENWLDIPGYTPPTINKAEDLLPLCEEVLLVVKGSAIERVCAAYDLRYDCWDFDMPILIIAGSYCIDVINSKFNYVSICLNRVHQELKTNRNWWDGEDWIREYRDYPVDSVLGERIVAIRPSFEDDPKYTNFGDLNGVQIILGN